MNLADAVNLIDDQPIGTYLITAVPESSRNGGWTPSAFMKTSEGWASKSGVRVGHPERFHAHNLAPIIMDNEDVTFIWSFS